MMDRRRLRWALVGTSEFATEWIAPAIKASDRGMLAAVVSRDVTRARAAAARLGAPLHATSLADLPREEVDAVHLVVPNDLHASLAIEAAELGLHVLVEKPMACSTAEARRMIEAARRTQVVLAVGHCMAWAPPVVTAQDVMASGKIGRPLLAFIAASSDSPPAGTWRQETRTDDGGGPLPDLGSHAIDALLRFLGPARSVGCRLGRARYDYLADDTATLLLRFASGSHGIVQTTFTCAQNDFVIQGSEGRLTSREWLGRDFTGDLSWQVGGSGVGRFDFDRPAPADQRIRLDRTNVYMPQVEEVTRAITEGAPLRISAEAGFAVMAVIDAAVRSARSGTDAEIETL